MAILIETKVREVELVIIKIKVQEKTIEIKVRTKTKMVERIMLAKATVEDISIPNTLLSKKPKPTLKNLNK